MLSLLVSQALGRIKTARDEIVDHITQFTTNSMIL